MHRLLKPIDDKEDPMKKSEIQALQEKLQKATDLNNAMFRFIQKHHPQDFNLFGFMLHATQGNTPAMVSCLDAFITAKEEAQDEK